MPCDSVTTQSVNLAKAMPDILRKALESMGWTVSSYSVGMITARPSDYRHSLTWTAGQGLTVRGGTREEQEKAIASISQAYSKAAISWAAQRAGWTIKSSTGNKVQIERR